MRAYPLMLLLTLLVSCNRPKEVHGIYLSQDGKGAFFPCDDSTMVMHVEDSTLAARYREVADSTNQPLVVSLLAVQRDSGSIYGGRHFLEIREVIDIRARAPGDCPGIAMTSPPLQSGL
jgi:hypothetical protein